MLTITSSIFAIAFTTFAVVALLDGEQSAAMVCGVVAIIAGGIAVGRIVVATRARRAALGEWRTENASGLRDLRAMGPRGALALTSGARALRHLEKGDPATAVRVGSSAIDTLRGRAGAEMFLATLLPYRAVALGASGDLEAARASLDEGLSAFAGLQASRQAEVAHVPVQLERVRLELASERFDLPQVLADLAQAESSA